VTPSAIHCVNADGSLVIHPMPHGDPAPDVQMVVVRAGARARYYRRVRYCAAIECLGRFLPAPAERRNAPALSLYYEHGMDDRRWRAALAWGASLFFQGVWVGWL
jgi:hypothetical protein